MHSFPNELLWIPLPPGDGKIAEKQKGPLEYGKCQTGNAVPAVILRSPAARFLIIYLHSNGEDIGLAYPFGCGLRMVLEVHVLLVEYPGYGICPGQCSEEAIWQAAQAAFRFATETLNWPTEDVIIMGRSLGAAVAMRLACSYACHGLILVAPFLSLVEAVSQYIGKFAPMFVGNAFCNKDFMVKVHMPTLVIHGLNDRLVACTQGQQLWEMCPHKKKLFVCPEQMSHNSDLLSNADFLIRPMLRFFALPDYSFVDIEIPSEAFDKRHCPQYHSLCEAVKGDKPLSRPDGDKEPCPTSATIGGPQSDKRGLCFSPGDDDDDLLESGEHSVHDPVSSPVASPRMQNKGPKRRTKQEDIDHLHCLAAEIGLRLPSARPVQIAPVNEKAEVLPDRYNAPMPELTEEMLGDLGAFLRGEEQEQADEQDDDPLPMHLFPVPKQRSAHAVAVANGLHTRNRSRTSGPAQEHAPPVELVDLGEQGLGGDLTSPTSTLGTSPLHSRQVLFPSDSIEGDRVPEEADGGWAVHEGMEPTFMPTKPSLLVRSHLADACNNDDVFPAGTPAGAADITRLWTEGSTAVPPTAEASVSRWSEQTSDGECKAPPAHGTCIINLDNGISRFLHESDGTEEEVRQA